MLCTLDLCQDLGNNHSGYDNHSCINFPFRHALNQVDSSTDLLDKVILIEVVITNQKTKECRFTQIDTKEK